MLVDISNHHSSFSCICMSEWCTATRQICVFPKMSTPESKHEFRKTTRPSSWLYQVFNVFVLYFSYRNTVSILTLFTLSASLFPFLLPTQSADWGRYRPQLNQNKIQLWPLWANHFIAVKLLKQWLFLCCCQLSFQYQSGATLFTSNRSSVHDGSCQWTH